MSNAHVLPYVETVSVRMGNIILASTVKPASEQDVQMAKERYACTGRCDHSIVVDEDCWPYYIRSCHICNEGLGLI